jgi:hypothetical protein
MIAKKLAATVLGVEAHPIEVEERARRNSLSRWYNNWGHFSLLGPNTPRRDQ